MHVHDREKHRQLLAEGLRRRRKILKVPRAISSSAAQASFGDVMAGELPGVGVLGGIRIREAVGHHQLFHFCFHGRHRRLKMIVDPTPAKVLRASGAHPPQHLFPCDCDHTRGNRFEPHRGSFGERAVLRFRGSLMPVPALPPQLLQVQAGICRVTCQAASYYI